MEIIYGQIKNRVLAMQLVNTLDFSSISGTLYLGYPVLASADERIEVDALLVNKEHGLIAFQFSELPQLSDDTNLWQKIKDDQDKLYFALQNNLSRHNTLRSGRELGIEINTITLFPVLAEPPSCIEGIYSDIDHLIEKIERIPPIKEEFLKPLQAALQRVTTIKPLKKRTSVSHAESRGAILKKIEKEIANLDQWQKRAAIESPEGPQRIRGLAGSGKTIVLALKAAYLHVQHPDWNIAVTFHTRSLYQQFKDLIRRFSFEHLNDEPNWQKLRVIHSWGGSDRDGIYTEIARHCQITPKDFLYAKNLFGTSNAFTGICEEILSLTSNFDVAPIYDVVLIDEAQDLPPTFFQLVYRFTLSPKRIIWAYDELQKLSEGGMPTTEELFGKDSKGKPLVQLRNIDKQPRQDIILPVCYRNTPWALTLAHALGFGIYRRAGLVQHFDEPTLWTEIGYNLIEGELELGKSVVLERDPNSYPEYFTEYLNSKDAIIYKIFNDEIEQIEWVAESIRKNLEEDELEIDDMLIILTNAYTAKKKGPLVMEALIRRGIESHLAGITSSRDEIFSKQSVAIANIYRSKGNEAPMVYILNCQHCFSGYELITLRNILFTAITRCRAWVRLCGFGPDMEKLTHEIKKVHDKDFRLAFSIPTSGELKKLRMIHRDRTGDEKAKIKKAEKGLKEFLEAINRGDLDLENLPLDLRTKLANLLNSGAQDDENTK